MSDGYTHKQFTPELKREAVQLLERFQHTFRFQRLCFGFTLSAAPSCWHGRAPAL